MTLKFDTKMTLSVILGMTGWGKFYPKRVIQIGGVEIESDRISYVSFWIKKILNKNFWIILFM